MAPRNQFLRTGLPLVGLVVLGSLGLSTLVQGKNDIGDARKQRRTLTTREYDLEQDYKRTMEKLNPQENELEIVRIPRPADETEA